MAGLHYFLQLLVIVHHLDLTVCSWTAPRPAFYDCVPLSEPYDVSHVWWTKCCSSQHTAYYWPKRTTMVMHRFTYWPKRRSAHTHCGVSRLLTRGGDRAAASWTYRAFPGTPPASGSGSPRRTWPLRKPAAPEAATWAASWLWADPSNYPNRGLVSPCSEDGDTENTHTHTSGGFKRCVCAWPCVLLCPCVDISHCVNP